MIGPTSVPGELEFIEPLENIPLDVALPFNCDGMRLRDPRETKGQEYFATTEASKCCGTDCC